MTKVKVSFMLSRELFHWELLRTLRRPRQRQISHPQSEVLLYIHPKTGQAPALRRNFCLKHSYFYKSFFAFSDSELMYGRYMVHAIKGNVPGCDRQAA